jgi:hypothetical protein
MQLDQLIHAYLAFQSTSGFDGLADPEQSPRPTADLTEKVITVDVVDLFCVFLPIFPHHQYLTQPLLSPQNTVFPHCCG